MAPSGGSARSATVRCVACAVSDDRTNRRGSATVRHGEAGGVFNVLWRGAPGCASNRSMRPYPGAYAVLSAIVRCVGPRPSVLVDHALRPEKAPGVGVERFERRRAAVGAPDGRGVRPFGRCAEGRLSDPLLRRVRSAGARIGETSSAAVDTRSRRRLSDDPVGPCPIIVRPRASDNAAPTIKAPNVVMAMRTAFPGRDSDPAVDGRGAAVRSALDLRPQSR